MSGDGDRRLILIGGGARSGKSAFALHLAERLGGDGDGGGGGGGARTIFIATAEALDGEMAERIARHRAERGAGWRTVEAPVALPEALDQAAPAVVLVDCLTLWISNLLVRGAGEADLAAAFDRLDAALDRRRAPIVLVTNEVGMGLVPETPLGRAFRDATGRLHQRLARRSDEVYAAILGMVLRLRPGPVEALAVPVAVSRVGAGSAEEP